MPFEGNILIIKTRKAVKFMSLFSFISSMINNAKYLTTCRLKTLNLIDAIGQCNDVQLRDLQWYLRNPKYQSILFFHKPLYDLDLSIFCLFRR